MTDMTTQERSLPRSYMSEAKKAGLTQNAIYLCESLAADTAGDEDASWRWLALAKGPEWVKNALIENCGKEFLQSKGFDV
jgi:hypothetical protein